jgi:hypothetical protein
MQENRMEVRPMCYTLNEIKEKTVPIAQSYEIQSLGVWEVRIWGL